MKKIISFCAYGKDPKYVHSALKNIDLQPMIYPDWTCRIYVSKDIPEDAMKLLLDSPAEIVVKEPVKGHLGMFWRFEPLTDKTIERFIVRDTDSRINPREADAIQEWVESGSEFHIIRDNPYHNAKIVGGLWGASHKFIDRIAEKYPVIRDQYLKNLPPLALMMSPRGPYFNTDQPFLWQYIWPYIVNTHLAHVKPGLSQLIFTGRERFLKVELPNNGFCGQDLPFEA
jgi:hypothetical protein